MLDQNIVAKLKEKYSHLHPLLFHRSVERARSNGDLFDILDTVPQDYPLVWNDKDNRWAVCHDLFLKKELNEL
jgi:hypothetical protein